MAKKIRWAIIGCGKNAHRFAEDMAYTKHCKLEAVGSRSLKKAEKFGARYKVNRVYGSYEQLAADKDVDAVYIATPHPFHMENTLMSIDAGKAVLCEKPFAMNARQVQRMKRAAIEKGVFLMEGMWTRFFPAIKRVNKILNNRTLGQILEVKANFGIHFQVGPSHRIHNPKLGGGALLDLGIYVVSFAFMVYGKQPNDIASVVHMEKTGVDDQASLVFQYDNCALATLSFSTRVLMNQRACIYGTKGMVLIPEPFYRPSQIIFKAEGRKEKILDFPNPGYGFHFEADHVAECIRKGKLQSELMPLDESIAIMETMDKIRNKWKLKYPNE